MNKTDPSLEHDISSTLDARQAGLDDDTRARLRRARAKAVAASEGRPWWQVDWALPAAFATVAALGVGIVLWVGMQSADSGLNGLVEASLPDVLIELASADVDIELLEDDIEFYDWLVLAQVEPDPQ